jgi:hypothetical protein
MEKITIRPIGAEPHTVCWHCGRPIERDGESHAARYLYRGEQPDTAVIEDWIECACGAFQNVRRLNEITVEPVGPG